MLETTEIETAPKPAASIIWLHGLGADGHDFEPIVPQLADATPPVRYVFPHAPVRPVTINGGMPMRAWYDVTSFDAGRHEDQTHVETSAQEIQALVAREVQRGSAAERIVLAGFSQGAALALHVGLRHAQALAGIMALSSYLPLASKLEDERSQANQDTPIFMAHGTADPVLPIGLAEAALAVLTKLGYSVQFKRYPGLVHGVSPEEVSDIHQWLGDRLG